MLATNRGQCAAQYRDAPRSGPGAGAEGQDPGAEEAVRSAFGWVAQRQHGHLVSCRQTPHQVVEGGDAPVVLGGAESRRNEA
jgi:hypothetical protein